VTVRSDAPSPEVSVLIVDDHATLTEAIELALGAAPSPIVVHIADELGDDAVCRFADLRRPDVILLDLDLGCGSGGAHLVEALSGAGHHVVLFTGATDDAVLGHALLAGAHGVIPKSAPFVTLLAAIDDAANGRNVTRPAEYQSMVEAARRQRADDERRAGRIASLTPREAQVLERLSEGDTASEIALADYVAVATVRSQIRSILRKLDVSSQLAAVAIYRDR